LLHRFPLSTALFVLSVFRCLSVASSHHVKLRHRTPAGRASFVAQWPLIAVAASFVAIGGREAARCGRMMLGRPAAAAAAAADIHGAR